MSLSFLHSKLKRFMPFVLCIRNVHSMRFLCNYWGTADYCPRYTSLIFPSHYGRSPVPVKYFCWVLNWLLAAKYQEEAWSNIYWAQLVIYHAPTDSVQRRLEGGICTFVLVWKEWIWQIKDLSVILLLRNPPGACPEQRVLCFIRVVIIQKAV